MPIEIRELVIKATVVQGETGATGSVGGGGSVDNNTSPNEEIIKTCVEKVLEILKDKNER
jgi:Family of unknown function (DUF5908)